MKTLNFIYYDDWSRAIFEDVVTGEKFADVSLNFPDNINELDIYNLTNAGEPLMPIDFEYEIDF